MEIHFLAYDNVEELDLAGPWEFAGLLAERRCCSPPKLVSLNSLNPVGANGLRFAADLHYSDAGIPDVAVLPGGSGARTAMLDQGVLEYLQRLGNGCQSVLSICTGSYLMQKAGLLKGHKATSHWAFLQHLRSDPDVEVVEDRFVSDGNIWTSAGVSAGMDMMLAFIAETFGEAVAADVQLEAEYFPSDRIYGRPFDRADVPAYIRRLGNVE